MTIWETLLATIGVLLLMGVLVLLIVGITILTTLFSIIGYILVFAICFWCGIWFLILC